MSDKRRRLVLMAECLKNNSLPSVRIVLIMSLSDEPGSTWKFFHSSVACLVVPTTRVPLGLWDVVNLLNHVVMTCVAGTPIWNKYPRDTSRLYFLYCAGCRNDNNNIDFLNNQNDNKMRLLEENVLHVSTTSVYWIGITLFNRESIGGGVNVEDLVEIKPEMEINYNYWITH